MQKRLLALVATVAMVLSMFAGIAFATDERVTGVDRTGVDFNYDAASKIVTVKVEPAKIAEVENGATPPVKGRWFVAAVIKSPKGVEVGEKVYSVKKDGEERTVYPDADGGASLTVWLDAKDTAFQNRWDIQWVEGGAIETYTIKYEPVIPNEYAMQLGVEKVISSGKTVGYQQVSGVIARTKGNQDVGDFKIDVIYDGKPQMTIDAPKGQFNFYLPTNIVPQDVKLSVQGVTELSGEKAPVIAVRYNVTTTPEELKFAYSDEQSPVTVTGRVTDSNGKPVDKATYSLVGDHTGAGLSGITNANGEFGFVILKWAGSSKYALNVAEQPHKTVTVAPKAAELTVSPKSVVHSLVPVKFTVKGAGFLKDTTPEVILYDGSDEPVAVAGLIVNKVKADGTFEATFNWMPSKPGSYTVKASASNHGATATITVDNPLGYNFINTDQLTSLKVGRNELQFGKPSGTYLVTYDGKATLDEFVYDVYVDGKLQLEKKPVGLVVVDTAKLGTKTIKVVAFKTQKDDKGNWVQAYQQTFEAKIVGWDVTMDPTTITVNQAQDITFVVKDGEGNPINNATITIGNDLYKVGPHNYNAQNGTYVIKDVKIGKADQYPVKVELLTATNPTKATLTLDVVGQKVYDVSSDVDALLQGNAQKVKLTVTKDGTAVIPPRVTLVYADGTVDSVTPTYLGDGITQVTINAQKVGQLVIRPETFDKNLCGEVTVDVVAPKLVLVDEEVANLTENFKTAVKFKVVDPRDDSVIKKPIEVVAEHAEVAIRDANDGLIVGGSLLGAEEHAISVLATKADYKAAEKDEELVAVYLKVNGALVDGHFEVMPATITSDPEMIIIGAKNNLTLTYLDANGKPIEGKAVKANGTKIGETDANGQVVYPAGVVASAVEVTADTDVKDVTVDKTIKIGYDFEAPQVTYEVDGNKATLIITDNVRLVRININGEEIDFWPGARYEHVVTLNPGVNKVRVKAQDSNDNVLDEVVEIEYKTDSIVLKDDKVQRQGDYLFVQARQFEEFGAKFAWNGETRTATFVIGDDKVEVTIGSTTAVVNGEAVTMPVAAFIADGRTYVPVRFVSENLGWNVHWAQGDIVTITLP